MTTPRLRHLRHPGKRGRGFTLMEVVLALGVFSLAAVALTEALSQMGLATLESAESAWRLEVVRAYLEEVGKAPEIEPGTNVIRLENTEHFVRITVEPVEVYVKDQSAPLPDLYQVSVQLFRTARGNEEQLLEQGSTYRYRYLYAN